MNKTNMKLGGLNCHVMSARGMLGENDLFIGLGINHAAGGLGQLDVNAAPSVLGVSFNYSFY